MSFADQAGPTARLIVDRFLTEHVPARAPAPRAKYITPERAALHHVDKADAAHAMIKWVRDAVEVIDAADKSRVFAVLRKALEAKMLLEAFVGPTDFESLDAFVSAVGELGTLTAELEKRRDAFAPLGRVLAFRPLAEKGGDGR